MSHQSRATSQNIVGLVGDVMKKSISSETSGSIGITIQSSLLEELSQQCIVCMNYLMENCPINWTDNPTQQTSHQNGDSQKNGEMKYLLYIFGNIQRLLDSMEQKQSILHTLANFFKYCIDQVKYVEKFNTAYNSNPLTMSKLVYHLKILVLFLKHENHEFHNYLIDSNISFYSHYLYKTTIKFLTNYHSITKLVGISLHILSQCCKFLNQNDIDTIFSVFCTYLIYKIRDIISFRYENQLAGEKIVSGNRDLFEDLIKSTTTLFIHGKLSDEKKIKILTAILNIERSLLFNKDVQTIISQNVNNHVSLRLIDFILKLCSTIYIFISQLSEQLQNADMIGNFLINFSKGDRGFIKLVALVAYFQHKKSMDESLSSNLLDEIWKIIQFQIIDNFEGIISTVYSLIAVQVASHLSLFNNFDIFIDRLLSLSLKERLYMIPTLESALKRNLSVQDLKLLLAEYQKSSLYSYIYLLINNLVMVTSTPHSIYIQKMFDMVNILSQSFSLSFNKPKKDRVIEDLVSMEELKFHLKNISSSLLIFILKIYTENSKLFNNIRQNISLMEKNKSMDNEDIILILKILASTEFMKDLDSVSVYSIFLKKIIQYHPKTIELFVLSDTTIKSLGDLLFVKSYQNNMVYLSTVYFYLGFFILILQSKQFSNENLFKQQLVPFMFNCLIHNNKQIVQQAHQLFITFFTDGYKIGSLILPYYLKLISQEERQNNQLQQLFCSTFHLILNHLHDNNLIDYSLSQIEQLILRSEISNQKKLVKQLIILLFNCTQTIDHSHLKELFSILRRVISQCTDQEDKNGIPLVSLLRDFYQIVHSSMDYTRRDDCVQLYLEFSNYGISIGQACSI